MITRDLKISTVVNEDLCFLGSGGVMALALSMTKAKKEFNLSMTFPVEIMISGFTSACRGKDTTGLRWPKKSLDCNQPVRGARNPLIW